MQLSNALSQEFVRMTAGKREVVIDSTLSGMGRGAGNTPTELIMQYLVDKQGASYDIDEILDLIDIYMDNLKSKCTWGYEVGYYVAGAYGAHVNNISYLKKKNSISSKDIRYILNTIGRENRKRYNYDLLEETYLNLFNSKIDDTAGRETLKRYIENRKVLLVAPGNTVKTHYEEIERFIHSVNPVVITVNFIHSGISTDFAFFSNIKRYNTWRTSAGFNEMSKIMTSNISGDVYNSIVIGFSGLVKCGWETMDNSSIMLLRLLDQLEARHVAIAGFDGYSVDYNVSNFLAREMELKSVIENATEINQEISEMLADFMNTKSSKMKIEFITPSRFANVVNSESTYTG